MGDLLTEWFVGILNGLSTGAQGGVNALLQSPAEYSPALYNAALTIHNTAVKPVTAIVLSIMFVLMLATTSTRAEGDRELGVRIIAATMFKIAMVFVVAQSAVLILDAISSVATTLANGANSVVSSGASVTAEPLGEQMRADIEDMGVTEKMFSMVLLLLPFLFSRVAAVIAIVLVFVRFLQMYLLTAFASLPIAFLGHEDTKGIGIGYLKGFATVALTGVVIVVAVAMYESLMGGWLGSVAQYDGDFTGYIFKNFGNFLVAPAVLVFILFGANGLAKKVIGEG